MRARGNRLQQQQQQRPAMEGTPLGPHDSPRQHNHGAPRPSASCKRLCPPIKPFRRNITVTRALTCDELLVPALRRQPHECGARNIRRQRILRSSITAGTQCSRAPTGGGTKHFDTAAGGSRHAHAHHDQVVRTAQMKSHRCPTLAESATARAPATRDGSNS